MPQGFPDPFSAATEGFRQSFFPMLTATMQKQRQEKQDALKAEEIKMQKKNMAINQAIVMGKIMGNEDAAERNAMLDWFVRDSDSGIKPDSPAHKRLVQFSKQADESARKRIGTLIALAGVKGMSPGDVMGMRIGDVLKLIELQSDVQSRKEFSSLFTGAAPGAPPEGIAAAPQIPNLPTGIVPAGIPEGAPIPQAGLPQGAAIQSLPAAATPPAAAATPLARKSLSDMSVDELRSFEAFLRGKIPSLSPKVAEQAMKQADSIAKMAEAREKASEAPKTREVKRGDKIVMQEWNRKTGKFVDVSEAPRFEGKTLELTTLQRIRDELPENDPRRTEIDKRINKLTETSSRFMGFDDQGRPVYAEGAAASTVAEKSRLQQERRLGETIGLELKELHGSLSKSDVGIRGFVNELKNTMGAQLIPALNDPKVTKNRALMRSVREKGMRLMSTDNRFNVQDRNAIAAIFPSDGLFESHESAMDKISMLSQIIRDRTTYVSGQLRDRKPIQDMTPNEIASSLKSGKIDRTTALRALRLFHGFQ